MLSTTHDARTKQIAQRDPNKPPVIKPQVCCVMKVYFIVKVYFIIEVYYIVMPFIALVECEFSSDEEQLVDPLNVELSAHYE
jgi:hypothetical protein